MKIIKNTAAVLLLLFFLGYNNFVQAQSQSLLKPKFGLRAGASFSTVLGPQEEGVDEQHKVSVRVVVGGTVKLPFHERFGITAEVLFVQKGSYYIANANNSFLKLPQFGAEQPHVYGYNKINDLYEKRTDKTYKRKVGMNVINGYIEVPVMFYGEAIDDKLQFDLGVAVGVLISTQALGTIKFGETSILDADNPDATQFIEMDLDYKYIKDQLGAYYDGSQKSAKIDGTTRYYPRGPSAYYMTDVKDKADEHVYNLLDVSLQAGVSYFFTPGLRAGVRFNYSLIDVTTNKYDYSLKNLNPDGTYIVRNDYDANFGFQIFVGLQF